MNLSIVEIPRVGAREAALEYSRAAGVLLVRGERAFTLSAPEAKKLAAAIER